MNELMIPNPVIAFGEGEKIVFSDSPKWQPVSTAPRDGSWFLAWVPYTIGWADISGVGPIRICKWADYDNRFIDVGNYTIGDRILKWSPFPLPPAEAQTVIIDSETGAALPEWDDEEELP